MPEVAPKLLLRQLALAVPGEDRRNAEIGRQREPMVRVFASLRGIGARLIHGRESRMDADGKRGGHLGPRLTSSRRDPHTLALPPRWAISVVRAGRENPARSGTRGWYPR